MQDDVDSPLSRFVGIGAAALFVSYLLSPTLARLQQEAVASAAYLGGAALLWFYKPFFHGKVFGWLSVVIGGGYAAISGFILFTDIQKIGRDDAANAKRCLAIQHDMLSARPRRSDAPDLFQALGCRPQGEGSVYAPPIARKR